MKMLPPRRRVRVYSYVAVVFLMALAVDLVLARAWRRISPSEATTRVTGPLLPDGRVDYLAALDDRVGKGINPQDNAAIPMLEAFGRAVIPSYQPRDALTNMLGMPPKASSIG